MRQLRHANLFNCEASRDIPKYRRCLEIHEAVAVGLFIHLRSQSSAEASKERIAASCDIEGLRKILLPRCVLFPCSFSWGCVICGKVGEASRGCY